MTLTRIVGASLCYLLVAHASFAQPAPAVRVIVPAAEVNERANKRSAVMMTALSGTVFEVVDKVGDWYWIVLPRDMNGTRRIGWINARSIEIAEGAALAPGSSDVNAKVDALQAQVQALHAPQAARATPIAPDATAVVDTTAAASAAEAIQGQVPQKSYSSKFFYGVGLESNGIVTGPSGSTISESGAGVGVVLGYGFSPRWSLYGEVSAARINAFNGGTYSLAHVDIGTRVHFLAGTHRVVPFVQAGLSGRAESSDFGTGTETASGAGVAFGGGLNIHFKPSFAFSGAVTWSVGDFTNFQSGGQNVEGSAVTATSARIHLGVIWFPQAPRR